MFQISELSPITVKFLKTYQNHCVLDNLHAYLIGIITKIINFQYPL